jgi:hypothetical protein
MNTHSVWGTKTGGTLESESDHPRVKSLKFCRFSAFEFARAPETNQINPYLKQLLLRGLLSGLVGESLAYGRFITIALRWSGGRPRSLNRFAERRCGLPQRRPMGFVGVWPLASTNAEQREIPAYRKTLYS